MCLNNLYLFVLVSEQRVFQTEYQNIVHATEHAHHDRRRLGVTFFSFPSISERQTNTLLSYCSLSCSSEITTVLAGQRGHKAGDKPQKGAFVCQHSYPSVGMSVSHRGGHWHPGTSHRPASPWPFSTVPTCYQHFCATAVIHPSPLARCKSRMF